MRHESVLFVCRDNALLSPLAEAIVNAQTERGLRAFSAGFDPINTIRPQLKRLLRQSGLPIEGLQPKPWQIFAQPMAPEVDEIICFDRPVGHEVEAAFPGKTVRHFLNSRKVLNDPMYMDTKLFKALDNLTRLAESGVLRSN